MSIIIDSLISALRIALEYYIARNVVPTQLNFNRGMQIESDYLAKLYATIYNDKTIFIVLKRQVNGK